MVEDYRNEGLALALSKNSVNKITIIALEKYL
jgi:hypothetical protein